MRMFLALELPSTVVDYLTGVMKSLAERVDGVRWVKNEGIHITTKFLGEVEESKITAMHEALKPLGEMYSPIPAALDKIDALPNKRRARVIVVTLGQGVEAMERIFFEVEERLDAVMEIEREERAYLPHITLGRRKVPKPFPNGDVPDIQRKEFMVEHLVLFKSTLTSGGAIYTPLWKIKLGGQG
ncbi:MAG TPA: RNA 2',3'-cyclic phosphodiesterase [Deltaproteobacteria bacterium]|nr:RNA 2',3'-cyclic phosphodiesterase [Deltaproteobacteria bacterium]